MFRVGEILDFRSDLPEWKRRQILSKYPLFIGCHFNMKCVVIRMIDSEQYLVAPCTIKTRSAARKCFDLSLDGGSHTVLVATQKFYVINGNLFSLCEIVSSINRQDISLIYEKKEHHKQKAFEMNERRKREKQEQKQRYFQLKQKYEIAVINNDRVTMQTIIDELGYAPIGMSSSKSRSASYSCKNPKPYQGGRFSPK